MSDSKILTPQERLDLQSLIKANDTDDCTEEIRNKKQSVLIRNDVKQMLYLKQKYSRLQKSNPQEFDKICISQCQFLFNNYTDIYNKIKSDLLNLNIFDNAHAALILTEWEEFKNINWENVSKKMAQPAWIIDSRSIVNPEKVLEAKLNLWRIGDGSEIF